MTLKVRFLNSINLRLEFRLNYYVDGHNITAFDLFRSCHDNIHISLPSGCMSLFFSLSQVIAIKFPLVFIPLRLAVEHTGDCYASSCTSVKKHWLVYFGVLCYMLVK